MAKFVFLRATSAREDSVLHAEGDVVELTDDQAARWIRRGAIEPTEPTEPVKGKKGKPAPEPVAAPDADAKPEETKTDEKPA